MTLGNSSSPTTRLFKGFFGVARFLSNRYECSSNIIFYDFFPFVFNLHIYYISCVLCIMCTMCSIITFAVEIQQSFGHS